MRKYLVNGKSKKTYLSVPPVPRNEHTYNIMSAAVDAVETENRMQFSKKNGYKKNLRSIL